LCSNDYHDDDNDDNDYYYYYYHYYYYYYYTEGSTSTAETQRLESTTTGTRTTESESTTTGTSTTESESTTTGTSTTTIEISSSTPFRITTLPQAAPGASSTPKQAKSAAIVTASVLVGLVAAGVVLFVVQRRRFGSAAVEATNSLSESFVNPLYTLEDHGKQVIYDNQLPYVNEPAMMSTATEAPVYDTVAEFENIEL
jgi:hypothetical protein